MTPRRTALALAAALAASAACADRPTRESAAAAWDPTTAGTEMAPVSLGGVDLTGAGYDRGDPRAPVVVVEFSDFGCPYCARHALETFPVLEREFVATGRVLWKYVPFVMGMFPNGDRAARAAECAGEQGAFWPMHDRVYAEQRAWKTGGEPDALFARAAAGLGLDAARFASCYQEGRPDARTARNNEASQMLGVRATPTFFVNGRRAEGAIPLDVFRRVLNEMATATATAPAR